MRDDEAQFRDFVSVQQTAEALGCPEGTVKVYTSRGLDGLRRILGTDISIETPTEGHYEVRSV